MKIIVNKDDIKKFDESSIGKTKNMYIKRATIIGIILTMFGLSYVILNIFNDAKIYDYIISIMSLLFGIYFIIYANIVKKKEVNKYIYEQKSLKK